MVGFPGAGPVPDEALCRHLLGGLPVDDGAMVVAVEAEGVGESFCEVPRAGEAALVVVAGFAGLPDLGQGGGEISTVVPMGRSPTFAHPQLASVPGQVTGG